MNGGELPTYGVRVVDDIILPNGKIVCTVWNGQFFATGVYSSHFHPLVVGDKMRTLAQALGRGHMFHGGRGPGGAQGDGG